MVRLFVAFAPPEEVAEAILDIQHGLPGAAWRPEANLHVTLRFIGETDGPTMRDVISSLGGVRCAPFEAALAGVGRFGGRRPRAVWAGVEAGLALETLQQKVEIACQRAGCAAETRRYTPHLTLAYLKGARSDDVAAFEARHGLFRTPSFMVSTFSLFSSCLGGETSLYEEEAVFPLDA